MKNYHQEAILSYEKAIESESDNYILWDFQGRALLKLERYKEAVISFDRAIEIKPDCREAWIFRSDALDGLQRYEEAIASCKKAIEIKYDEHMAWHRWGRLLNILGKYDEALTKLNYAQELDCNCSSGWNELGVVLSNLKRHEDAIAAYNKALKIKPDDYKSYHNRGFTLVNLERYNEAIVAYDEAIKIKPDFHLSWYSKGCALANLGEYEKAIFSYDKAIEIKNNEYTFWQNRGISLTYLGKYADAIASYDEAIKLEPDKHELWSARGTALHNLNQYQEALASYDKAIEIKLDDYDAWINRGLVLANLVKGRKYPESLFTLPVITSYPDLCVTFKNPDLYEGGTKGQFASYHEGLKHCPQNTEGWGKLHQAIGNAYYYQGCRKENSDNYWEKAVKSYNTALTTLTVEEFPEAHLEVLQNLIRPLLALQETAEASELQRRATDVLRKLLKETESPTQKQRLALKFASFQQFTVDLAVQSDDFEQALNLAEQGKNACLSWLFDGYCNESVSPKWEEIKQLLNPTTAIIYWHISPIKLHTFILTNDAPSPIILGETQLIEETGSFSQSKHLDDFEAWKNEWNERYTSFCKDKDEQQVQEENNWRDNLSQTIEELANILEVTEIIKLIQDSQTQVQNLILIPHRDLHRFPLHAMFADKFNITYLPSAQIGLSLQQLHQFSSDRPNEKKTQKLLSVEAPHSRDFEGKAFSELPHAKIESTTICQLFKNSRRFAGKSATKVDVINALTSAYQLFHFTGHGVYNFYNPKKSALALSDTDRLTVEDILLIRLDTYYIVSLSACETAVTGNQSITTEYVGLVSGFLRQGVAHVISTLWTIESVSSNLFMIEFYRQPDWDLAPAAALKRTQIWLRTITYGELAKWYEERAGEVRAYDSICAEDLEDEAALIRNNPAKINTQEPPYKDPYYWAAFTITGNINF